MMHLSRRSIQTQKDRFYKEEETIPKQRRHHCLFWIILAAILVLVLQYFLFVFYFHGADAERNQKVSRLQRPEAAKNNRKEGTQPLNKDIIKVEDIQVPPPPGKCAKFQSKSEPAIELDAVLQVNIVVNRSVLPRFSSPPAPRFSSQKKKEILCQEHRWYFCPGENRRYKENNQLVPGYSNQYWTSQGRLIIVEIPCARIFPAAWPNQGMLRDSSHRYVFSFQNDEKEWEEQGQGLIPGMKYYPALAYHATNYPGAFAHIFEGLPRLLLLLETLPQGVGIMIARSDASESLVSILEEVNATAPGRFIWWDPQMSYSIGTLYTAGEMCFLDGKWKVHSEEECGSRVFLPYSKIRESFIPLLKEDKSTQEHKPLVIVLSRADASNRRIANQRQVVRTVKDYYQDRAEVIEMVGREHPLRDQFTLFLRAKVVIAPHGAGLALCLLMDPRNSVVIEIGYDDEAGFPWPIQFYGAIFASAGLSHFVTLGKGSYYGDIEADIPDFLDVLKTSSYMNGL